MQNNKSWPANKKVCHYPQEPVKFKLLNPMEYNISIKKILLQELTSRRRCFRQGLFFIGQIQRLPFQLYSNFNTDLVSIIIISGIKLLISLHQPFCRAL